MGVIKFFLILFLIFILLGYIARFILRLFFKRLEKKFNNQATEQQRPEGEVYVDKGRPKDKMVDKNIGDYVDYEEVKD
jgi:flagellar biosynthesis/type III secretory pathway M-ring protein FliF/YscJ